MKVLTEDFFDGDAVEMARKLLGKYVVAGNMVGKIVETEAYAEDDPASHSFSGRGYRNAVMFGAKGKAYVYFTYGMYYCFNVVVGSEGKGEAVLIRAVEPLARIDDMRKNRKTDEIRNLTNGPAKFCMAFGIDKEFNGADLLDGGRIYLAEGDEEEFEVVEAKRIGISKGVDKLWRFYVRGNEFVSRK